MNELAHLFAQYGPEPLLNTSQTLIALVTADGKLLECNPAFDQLRVKQPAAGLEDWLIPASQSLLLEKMQTGEFNQISLSLKIRPTECCFTCLLIPVPEKLFLLCLEPDWIAHKAELTRLKRQLKTAQQALKLKQIDLESVLVQADEVSHTDALTFLPNRRQIIADLQRQVIASENSQKPLTIFMLDIDHFKHVNDTYGHPAGDQVLRGLAGRLQAGIRQTDLLGRYGGEEFLVLLPATTLKSALKTAERLLELARGLRIQLKPGLEIQITISLGIAQYRIGQEGWEALLNRADQAMYQSKNRGRDQWLISQVENDKQ